VNLFFPQQILFVCKLYNIQGNCAVNSHIVFSECFGIVSSPQIFHYTETQ